MTLHSKLVYSRDDTIIQGLEVKKKLQAFFPPIDVKY